MTDSFTLSHLSWSSPLAVLGPVSSPSSRAARIKVFAPLYDGKPLAIRGGFQLQQSSEGYFIEELSEELLVILRSLENSLQVSFPFATVERILPSPSLLATLLRFLIPSFLYHHIASTPLSLPVECVSEESVTADTLFFRCFEVRSEAEGRPPSEARRRIVLKLFVV